jgi:hypothetical protein
MIIERKITYMIKEIDIQKAVVSEFKKLYSNGIIFRVANEASYNRFNPLTGHMKGVSDLICVLEDRIIFLEVKTPKTKNNLSADQLLFRDNVNRLGFEYYVIWDSEMLEELIGK